MGRKKKQIQRGVDTFCVVVETSALTKLQLPKAIDWNCMLSYYLDMQKQKIVCSVISEGCVSVSVLS